jgi:hypothetical protein
MALQPIDLQTLFTQVDKVGKNQALLREGQQIQDSMNQIQNQKKLEENIQSVNETQDMGDEAEKIKDEKNIKREDAQARLRKKKKKRGGGGS